MNNVCVVIVNWNGKKDTLECIESIYKAPVSNQPSSIVVVDNGSTDGSVAALKNTFPSVTVITNSSNLGFTGGNNIGIQFALDHGARYVWLLNNDTIIHKNTLPELLDAFHSPQVGIVAPKIYFFPGREFHHDRYKEGERGKVIWYAGGTIDWANMFASHRGVDEVDHGQYDEVEETEFITGCSMCIRSEVIEEIGLLDNRYYVYLEDLDYSFRTKRAGFRLMYAPQSIIWHKNAGSTARPGNLLHQYYQTRNRLLIGFTYASFRTRLALIRESAGIVFFGPRIKRNAVLDFVFGKFGDRYQWK
jgi:GT2 family glycosyltransferase